MTTSSTEGTEAPAFLFDAPKPAKDTGRFGVYDRTLGRYVGQVTTKDKATKAAKDQGDGGGRFVVVEV